MRLTDDDLFLLSQCAISAACQAGHRIAECANHPVTVDTKKGGSSWAAQVVTEVDHLSQRILLRILLPTCARFDFALLSEESPDDGKRLHKDFFWCIDPLDGTLPFIEALPGYSVSIALVSREGEPLIGVIFDPLTHTLFHAVKGQGAWRNEQPISLTTAATQTLTFITDKSFAEDSRYPATRMALDHLAAELGYARASLKLQGGAAMNACQALTLPSACYFKFPKPHAGGGSIWDYAATSCLFHAVGASVSDIWGRPLVLNPSGSTFMNHCGVLYCADQMLAQRMVRLYQQLSAS